MMFSQELFINPRLIVEALEIPLTDQLTEVLITLSIDCQKNQMMGVILFFITPLVFDKTTLGGDIDLAADNRLDTPLFGFLVKIYGPEHITVISQGNSFHPVITGPLHKIGNPNSPIQEAIHGM